jgi:hypothetical protein
MSGRTAHLGFVRDSNGNYADRKRALRRNSLPARSRPVERRGGSSLLVPAGTKQGLDEYFVSDEHLEDLRHYTQSFAMYIITSMHLAGLDRRYGSMRDEALRLRLALGGNGDGASIDYELMFSLRSVDTSPLQLIVDSMRENDDKRGQKSFEVFTRLSAALADVSRKSATRFMAGVPTSETSAAFQFLLGPTDPSEWIRELVGPSGRLLTPSPTAFLYLTVLDPFAYGISSDRAIMTFLASMMARAEIHRISDVDEQTSYIDSFIAQQGVASLLDSEAVDDKELDRLVSAMRQMPQYKQFVMCMLQHSAVEAPNTNPAFHAIYTVLKSTYLLHFACSWLSIQVSKIVEEEAAHRTTLGATASVPDRYILSQSNEDALIDALTQLELKESMLEVAKTRVPLNMRDYTSACADYLIALIAASTTAAHVEQASRTSDSEQKTLRVVFRPGGKPSAAPLPYTRLKDDLKRALVGIETLAALDTPSDRTKLAAALNDAATWDALKHVERTSIERQLALNADDMTVRGMHKSDAELFVERHAMHTTNTDELLFVGSAMRFYMTFLLHQKSISSPVTGSGVTGLPPRAYRLSTCVFFMYRLYDFMRMLYRMPAAKVDEPKIVTMLRRTAWSQSAGVESGQSAQAVFNKAFESFTYMLAHSTLYCHSLIGDMSRTTRLVHHIHKTKEHNVQLMGILQRTALGTVDVCHPFARAEATQMTLPASVAASILPTTHTAPLEWGPADLVFRSDIQVGTERIPTNDVRYLLRAVVGESAFAKLAHEQRGSINLIDKIKNAESSAILQAIQQIGAGGTV